MGTGVVKTLAFLQRILVPFPATRQLLTLSSALCWFQAQKRCTSKSNLGRKGFILLILPVIVRHKGKSRAGTAYWLACLSSQFFTQLWTTLLGAAPPLLSWALILLCKNIPEPCGKAYFRVPTRLYAS